MQQRSGAASLDESPAAGLYERYARTVLTYLRRRLPSREDAEDAMLEVFLAAFERDSLSALSEQERSAWLQQVARNKLIDYYRRSTRRSTVTLEEVEETLFDEARDPEQMALRHEEERRLRAAIRQMPPFQQEILRLRFGLGLRCTQIADQLGKREGAVRMALLRTLTLLRALYEEV
ncbi:MAG TPA: sigma-70 family RNA polymerase sigma factor [Ktedonobacterales bacterium]|nr:sigma-70 family RNA polymerase sigma factor [Ktedonobacterales bacterium]